MTPIHRANGKVVSVRSGHVTPSPYLRKIRPFLDGIGSFCRKHKEHAPRAVDLGCGNGRNSRLMAEAGYEVMSFDRVPDHGHALELGKDDIPLFGGTVNVVLLQFVLMFLGEKEIDKVIRQSFELCESPGAIVVELCPVKTGLFPEPKQLDAIQSRIIKAAKEDRGWWAYKPLRHHFVVTNHSTSA